MLIKKRITIPPPSPTPTPTPTPTPAPTPILWLRRAISTPFMLSLSLLICISLQLEQNQGLHHVHAFLTLDHQRNTRMKRLELHDNGVSKGRRQHVTVTAVELEHHQLSFGLPVLAAAARGKPKPDNDEVNSSNNQDYDQSLSSLSSSCSSSSSTSTSSSTTSMEGNIKNLTIPEIKLCRKLKQKRRKLKQPRRPSSFWADMDNIESELRKFWCSLNVPIASDKPPPIPNEALLNHFERNDLRYAIANMGGRDVVSIRLDGAKLIPGKWTKAVSTCKEVQYLLHPSNPAGKGLSEDVPPIAPYIKRSLRKQRLAMIKKKTKMEQKRLEKQQNSINKMIDVGNNYIDHDEKENDSNSNMSGKGENKDENEVGNKDEDYDDIDLDIDMDIDVDAPIDALRFKGKPRWAHSSRRNPRGHWSQDVIIQELYQYVSHVKEEKGRPSVWMPRPSELATEGRNDLKQAMVRFGGSAKTCELAKLVPYRDWRYFESTLELNVELLKYLIKYHNGSEKVFPKLADIQENGHERLYDLIMEYGGRKIIATKLDMEFQAQSKLDLFKGITYGPFSLDFAVRLMYFIRNDMMEKEPPLDKPQLQMPTKQYLLDRGEERLVKQIEKYGGHESVARRLYLAFDAAEAAREAKIKSIKNSRSP